MVLPPGELYWNARNSRLQTWREYWIIPRIPIILKKRFSCQCKSARITWPLNLTLTLSTPWMQTYLETIVCKFGGHPAIYLREVMVSANSHKFSTLCTLWTNWLQYFAPASGRSNNHCGIPMLSLPPLWGSASCCIVSPALLSVIFQSCNFHPWNFFVRHFPVLQIQRPRY